MIASRGVARVSLAVLLALAPLLYAVVSSVSNFNMNRIAYILYGDSSSDGAHRNLGLCAIRNGAAATFGMGIPVVLAGAELAGRL